MNRDLLTKEIDWLCFHAVGEGVLTKEQCAAVMEAIEENGLVPDLDLFVSVVLDNGICTDAGRVKAAALMARDEARMLGFPPRSIFDDSQPAAEVPPPSAPENSVGPKEIPRRAGASFRSAPAAPSAPVSAPSAPASSFRAAPVSGGGARQGAFAAGKASMSGGRWLDGWPKLADADKMDTVGAKELLDSFLRKARETGCSDVHVSAGAVPFVRRNKQVFLVPGQDVLSDKVAEKLNLSLLDEGQLSVFTENLELDYGYNMTADERYRANLMKQRLGVSGSYRVVDSRVRSIGELGFDMPEVIEKLTTYGQGLILVTGPVGSGKSSTLAALVESLNRNRQDHIITVEDPIETVFEPKGCNITQRELNRHTRSFGNALRAALREDPDIIVIGEMRDLETIEMAIHSSETGHLVIGTLHTNSAADTMNRILDVFPYGQQAQIRAMVAESLKGVICQQLLPNKDGDGVVLAYEILLGTLAVSNLIREGKTYQLESTIQTSKHLGMTTMEQSHFNLYMAGKRSYEQTLPFVKSGDLLRQMQMKEASSLGPAPGSPAMSASASEGNAIPKRKGWFGLGR